MDLNGLIGEFFKEVTSVESKKSKCKSKCKYCVENKKIRRREQENKILPELNVIPA